MRTSTNKAALIGPMPVSKVALRAYQTENGIPITNGRPPNVALSARDQELVRYFLEGRTLEETGQRFGITRERVRQILEVQGITHRTQGKKIKAPRPTRPTREQVFWRYVDKNGAIPPHLTTPCWNWTGALKSRNLKKDGTRGDGYGHFHFRGKQRGTHVVSWLLANRQLEPKQWVLHKCHNSRCVNPDHLYSGTPKDNAQDRENAGRGARKVPKAVLPDIESRHYTKS